MSAPGSPTLCEQIAGTKDPRASQTSGQSHPTLGPGILGGSSASGDWCGSDSGPLRSAPLSYDVVNTPAFCGVIGGFWLGKLRQNGLNLLGASGRSLPLSGSRNPHWLNENVELGE